MQNSESGQLVSVIMPAYNAEKYINDSVRSVLNQTYDNIELIIVDDASTDNTLDILYDLNDVRIKIMRHDQNMGPGSARNTAIETAQGQYMALIDADDQWHPKRLEELILALNKVGEGYFAADELIPAFDSKEGLKFWFSRNRRDYKLIRKSKAAFLSIDDYINFDCPAMCPIIPLPFIRLNKIRYNTESRLGEDIEFYFHLFRLGLKMVFLSKPYYYYRVTRGSLTKTAELAPDYVNAYKRLFEVEGFCEVAQAYFWRRIKFLEKEKDISLLIASVKNYMLRDFITLAVRKPLILFALLRRLPSILEGKIMAALAR